MRVVTGPDNDREQTHAFTQLVNQYQSALLRMCYLYLRDRSLAEDAVQETFMKAYRHIGEFRGDSSAKTWLMKIAMNVCCDTRRGAWFRFVSRRVTPDMLPEASVPFEAREEALVTDVMNLPIKLREVVLLYYYQDMNVMEIADSLGISQSSVSGRLKRARAKLLTVLDGRDR